MTAEEIKAKLAELEEAAVASFCRNPGWKREYDAAPEGAKRYYRHTFAFSVGAMGYGGREELVKLLAEAFEDEKNDIFRTMDDESWDYVIRNAGGPAKCGLHDVRIHMQGKEGVKMGDWFDDTYE